MIVFTMTILVGQCMTCGQGYQATLLLGTSLCNVSFCDECLGAVPLLLKSLRLKTTLAGKAFGALAMMIQHPPHRAAIARMKGLIHLGHWVGTCLDLVDTGKLASGIHLHETQLMLCCCPVSFVTVASLCEAVVDIVFLHGCLHSSVTGIFS